MHSHKTYRLEFNGSHVIELGQPSIPAHYGVAVNINEYAPCPAHSGYHDVYFDNGNKLTVREATLAYSVPIAEIRGKHEYDALAIAKKVLMAKCSEADAWQIMNPHELTQKEVKTMKDNGWETIRTPEKLMFIRRN